MNQRVDEIRLKSGSNGGGSWPAFEDSSLPPKRSTTVRKSAVCNPDRFGRILNPDRNGRNSKVLPFRQSHGVRRVSVLSELHVGDTAIVIALDLPESVQNHLMHMGFVPDAEVKALRRAPAGDPTVYSVDGMEIALRHETADNIRVKSPELDLQEEERQLIEAAQ
jgi:ferrous iron transport protein A